MPSDMQRPSVGPQHILHAADLPHGDPISRCTPSTPAEWFGAGQMPASQNSEEVTAAERQYPPDS